MPEQPDQPDTAARIRDALTAYLPDEEPPVGLRVEHVMRLGRRRHRALRMAPIAAAVVTALAIAVPLVISAGEPTPDRLPLGSTTSAGSATTTRPPSSRASVPSHQGSASATATGGNTTEPPGTAQPEFRLPAGHVRSKEADALAKAVAGGQPAQHVAAYFGTNSARPAGVGRYGFGFHILWQDGGRYGYLAMLHRTKGDFPAGVYGMPDEPCLTEATRLPAYHCTPVAVPDGDVAYSYEIDSGDHVRGVVWDKKDPNGAIRITGAFYLPERGAWTPFSALDTRPLLTSIPVSTADLAKMIGIP